MQGIRHDIKTMFPGGDLTDIPQTIKQGWDEELQRIWSLAREKATKIKQEGLATLERWMREEMLAMGGTVVSWIVERFVGTGYVGTSVRCEGCGNVARFVNHRSKTVKSLLMELSLKRAYYHCACGRSQIPLDRELGIEKSAISPGLKEAVVAVNAEIPFERAKDLLKDLSGVSYSKRDGRETTEAFGAELEKQAQDEMKAFWERKRFFSLENPDKPERLYISPDGTTVHMEEGWKEVKVASIFTATVPVKKEDEPVRLRTRYVSGTEGSEAFGRRVYMEAIKQGLNSAKDVVVIGDGAHWIWNEAEAWLPKDRTEIIDFYHASEKVWDAAKAAYGEGNAATAAWANQHIGKLRKGKVGEVIKALKRLKSRRERSNDIRRIEGYFQTNVHRMAYARFRRKGYFIGSGVTESSCKHLVGARCKQAGMEWLKTNVQSILQVRLARLNDRWDYLWRPRLN